MKNTPQQISDKATHVQKQTIRKMAEKVNLVSALASVNTYDDKLLRRIGDACHKMQVWNGTNAGVVEIALLLNMGSIGIELMDEAIDNGTINLLKS